MLELKSSDGVIFKVSSAAIRQMLTLQTMIDLEGEDSDEVVPILAIKGSTFEKILQWIEHHQSEHEIMELREIFEIIIGADYLEIGVLLHKLCRYVFLNNRWEEIENVANNFYKQHIVTLLKNFEHKHGYEVIISIQDNQFLTYFDPQVLILILLIRS